MKKFLAILLSLTFILACFTSCGKTDSTSNGTSTSTSTGTSTGNSTSTSTGGGTNDDDNTSTNLSGYAAMVVDSLFAKKLNVWEYLPETFNAESKEYKGGPLDYTDFKSVSQLPKMGNGEQLNMVYDLLLNAQKMGKMIEKVYSAADKVKTVYQKFIDENKDNYTNAELQTDLFNFKMVLTENTSMMLVNLSGLAVELYYNKTTSLYKGRIQLTDGATLKYEMSQSGFKMALNLINVALWQVEFNRISNTKSVGKVCEYYGVAGKYIKSVALIDITGEYISIIADKRDSDDLIVEAAIEVYDMDGRFVGGRIKETIKAANYDTYWFNLYNISGVNTIKKEDVGVLLNKDTIYINGSAEHIHCDVSIGIPPTRQYDIEFRTAFFYVSNQEGDGYDKVTYEIPQMFVQSKYLDTFEEAFAEANQTSGITTSSVYNTTAQSAMQAIDRTYETYAEDFQAMKAATSQTEITDYIGAKNAFFGA